MDAKDRVRYSMENSTFGGGFENRLVGNKAGR
jgi:hypothetical protein